MQKLHITLLKHAEIDDDEEEIDDDIENERVICTLLTVLSVIDDNL